MIHSTSLALWGKKVNAKDSGLVGLAVVGVLLTLIGFYVGYLWLNSGGILYLLIALVVVVSGITMAAIGFNSD